MTTSRYPSRAGWLIAIGIAAATVAILFAMGRPPICECGTVQFWHGDVQSAGNSQHIADWYTFSHITHGMIFYFAAYLLWRRWNIVGGSSARYALPFAVSLEGFWEILENSPMIIQRYREVTVSFGYSGDSIINSISDIGWMTLGFLLASRFPAWVIVVVAITFELFTLAMIRDNLTLNVIMLLWPVDALREWQVAV